ncbi:MAG: hypothetical protein VCC00_09265 [Deltaproteobacteria bacterium]
MLALCLALLQTALLTHTAWDKSDTADEVTYIAAAASLLGTGTTQQNCESPLLPKRGFGAALLLAGYPVLSAPEGLAAWNHLARAQPAEPDTAGSVASAPTPAMLQRLLLSARAATILVVVLAGLLLFHIAGRWGPGPALASHALWVSSPLVLAHGSLATLDAWTAATMVLVVAAAFRFVDQPRQKRAAMVGVACGLAAATKISTLAALPVLFLVLGLAIRHGPAAHGVSLGRAGIAAAAGFLLSLWAVYGLAFGPIDLANPCPFPPQAAVREGLLLPFPAWIEGLLFQLSHGGTGHANYLFGQVRDTGWWWFFAAALALEVPLGVQALVLLRGAAAVVRRQQPVFGARFEESALLAFPVLLFCLMSLARHQGSLSFLMPALPLVLLWLGRSLRPIGLAFPRTGLPLAALLIALTGAESLRVHPHHLIFGNLWAGGPAGISEYFVHRKDWGQDKRRLGEWQRAHGPAEIFYAPYGENASAWGIRWRPVPCTQTPGVYAIHEIEWRRPRFSLAPGCADWLAERTPDETIGHSIRIYRVP